MKLFQNIQKTLALLGINSNQQNRFNVKSMISHSVYGLGLISSAVFFFFKANTFEEYSNNAYITTSFAVCAACFTIFVFKTKTLMELIDDWEEFFEKSE